MWQKSHARWHLTNHLWSWEQVPWEKILSLTQNMQDRQTQVRAGPARAVGRLSETDGMVMDRSDAAAATDQWASSNLIQAWEELPNAAKPWLSWTQTLSFSSGSCFSPSSSLCFLLLCSPLNLNWILTASPLCSLSLSFPLPGKVSQSFFFFFLGGWVPPPLHRSKGGGDGPLIIHLILPLLSLSSLFTPLSRTTFNFIHSFIPPPPHSYPPQHPLHFTSPSLHLSLAFPVYFGTAAILIFHKLCVCPWDKCPLAFLLTSQKAILNHWEHQRSLTPSVLVHYRTKTAEFFSPHFSRPNFKPVPLKQTLWKFRYIMKCFQFIFSMEALKSETELKQAGRQELLQHQWQHKAKM